MVCPSAGQKMSPPRLCSKAYETGTVVSANAACRGTVNRTTPAALDVTPSGDRVRTVA